MCNEKKPRKHAALIKAWADGATIQYYSIVDKEWAICEYNPRWEEGQQYRIKPEPTDLDKYGVESGDIWRTEGNCIRVVGHAASVDIYGSSIKARLNTLLFRRGVVNKLGWA